MKRGAGVGISKPNNSPIGSPIVIVVAPQAAGGALREGAGEGAGLLIGELRYLLAEARSLP
jgi:hypothetical protein